MAEGNRESYGGARGRDRLWVTAAFAVAVVILALPVFFFHTRKTSWAWLELEQGPRVGALAPNFTLRDITGKAVHLNQVKGREPVLLNFWASWCLACREEAPYNQKAYERLGGQGLRFLSVSIDSGARSAGDVGAFVDEFQLTYAPLLDSRGEVYSLYAVTAIPTTFLIDRQGRIVAKAVGPENWLASEWHERWGDLLGGFAVD